MRWNWCFVVSQINFSNGPGFIRAANWHPLQSATSRMQRAFRVLAVASGAKNVESTVNTPGRAGGLIM
jgi:hypothetical protein